MIQIRRRVHQLLMSPISRESAQLAASSLIVGVLGFIFWLAASREYEVDEVGQGTAIVSMILLATLLSRLGLDISMMRFTREHGLDRMLGTSIVVSLIASIIFGTVELLYVAFSNSNLDVLLSPVNSILFIAAIAFSSVVAASAAASIAMRKPHFNLRQSLSSSIRVILLFPLVFLGVTGMLTAVAVSTLLTAILSIWWLSRARVKVSIGLDVTFLKKTWKFSAANYTSSLLMTAPFMLMPIVVIETLGSENAAVYYVSYSIAAFIFHISNAAGSFLIVHGSTSDNLGRTFRQTTEAMIGLSVPFIIVVFYGRLEVLSLFGSDYVVESGILLVIMMLSFLIAGFGNILMACFRVRKRFGLLIGLSVLAFLLPLALAIMLVETSGLMGIGFAWLASSAVLCIAAAPFLHTELRNAGHR